MSGTFMALDIETVPGCDYTDLSPTVQEWVDRRLAKINESREEEDEWNYVKLASLDWDLGKIVCISLGLYNDSNDSIRLKSIIDREERTVLPEFNRMIDGYRGDYVHYNGLTFDIPFILQRMAYHGFSAADPRLDSLARYRKSPHFDLMHIWANWDYTRTKPLNVLANISNLPNPKDEMDGSLVYEYFKDGKLEAIKRYCEFDTATVLNLYLHLIKKQEVVPLDRYEFS